MGKKEVTLNPRVGKILMDFFAWRSRAVGSLFDEPYKEKISTLYLESGRDRKNLVKTRQALEFWSTALHIEKWHHKLDELEGIVIDCAKQEWGKGTMVEFNRANGKVLVVNPLKARQELIVDFAFRPTNEQPNHQPEPPGAA